MQFAQWLLYNIPSVPLCIMIVAVSGAFSVAGLLIVRRYVPNHRLKTHHDIAGPIFATLGVVYAVLLAFVVIIAWQSFNESSVNVEKEANRLTDLVQDSGPFAQPFKEEINELASEYAKSVIDDEWAAMERGESSPRTHEVVRKIEALYEGYSPRTDTERIFFAESIRKLNELCELRRSRLIDSKMGIHPVLWLVLILGAITTISFTYFFGSENFNAQIMMVALLSTLLALILFTVLVFDFPFTGDVSVSPQAFKEMLKY
ncbi:MAG: DUF4239 domain-containing protein [Candidatus Omnitrophota bacterium]|nr:DUF4239 domain-containing protein [Candidatus Omnitrophota bacterium]